MDFTLLSSGLLTLGEVSHHAMPILEEPSRERGLESEELRLPANSGTNLLAMRGNHLGSRIPSSLSLQMTALWTKPEPLIFLGDPRARTSHIPDA